MVPAPPRSKVKGRLWQAAGGVLILIGVLLMGATGLGLPLVIFGVLGVSCILRGRRHLVMSGEELLARDPRPPVVYLRSFQADPKAARSADGSPFIGGIQRVFDTKTIEERLAEALTVIGPVVAIGKPGEELPSLGAARLYVDDQHWQETVHRLMSGAALVVLRLGHTPGFWWELEHSISLDPTKLVLVVPFTRNEYEAFRERTAQHFPHPLPPFGARIGVGSGRFRPRRGLGKLVGLIYFRRDWTPTFIDLTRIRYPLSQVPRYFARQRLTRSLNWNLRPVLDQLGVAWKPPKPRWLLVPMVALLLLMFAIGLGSASVDLLGAWSKSNRREAAVAAFVQSVGTSRENAGKLADAGWQRVSDDRVVERAAAMEEILKDLGGQACAELITKGTGRIEEFLPFSDPAISERWFALQTLPALAELRQSPEATDVDWKALKRIYNAFRADQTRFQAGPEFTIQGGLTDTIIIMREHSSEHAKALFTRFEPGEVYGVGFVTVSYDDVCHVLVNLHHAVSVLRPPDDAKLARGLAYMAAR